MTLTADREEQNDELLALSGILDQTAFSHSESQSGENKGVIEVDVRLPGDGLMEIVRQQGKQNFTVKYLPPVKLEFSLPEDYPSQSCPLYCITCPWLLEEQRVKVEDQLKNLWEEQGGGVILFTWLNFLQEEMLEFLGLETKIDISAFSARCPSSNEESQTNCDNRVDNIKLIDDDELITGPDVTNLVNEEFSPSTTQRSKPEGINLEEGAAAIENSSRAYKVIRWDVSEQYGVLETEKGEALVRHTSILGHNINKLEASLEEGEVVECRIENKKSTIKGITRHFEAFDVLGVGGTIVKGNKLIENVEVLDENVVGSVLKWNKRSRDGKLKAPKGDVYVYYTCVQENSLTKGDMVQFNVVKSHRWGVLASFVRKLSGVSSVNEDVKEWSRMKAERDSRNTSVPRQKTPVVLSGFIKKWDDVAGNGVIRNDQRKEWIFTYQECLVRREEGFRLFNTGDSVTFVEYNTAASQPRADKVQFAHDIDSGVSSNDTSEDNTEGETSGNFEDGKEVSNNDGFEKECVQQTTDKNACISGISGNKSADAVAVIPKRVRRNSSKQDQLATLLREFNNMKEEEEFAVSLNSCQICFTDKIGSQCLRFVVCNHVYCRECMTNYFTEKISTGAVSSLVCPTFKCETQALPNQVAELVPLDLFNKYESLLLETQLESMTDVMLCPRLVCQCPTMIDRDTNMGHCPACQFAFCIYCKATYHGVSPCKFKSSEQRAILERYKNSSGEERIFLEKRYGKKQLATMSATLASEDYMASHARQCPHCNAPIEKNEGCNKITCWRCNTHFCWLCGARLPQVNPYTHFNVQGGKCFGALFQGVDPMDGDDEFDDFFDEDDDWQEVQAALLGV